MMNLEDLGFGQMQARLRAEARRRIQSGEFTERGLARVAGLSQPHLHNVLKGVRDLSTASAEALLAGLGIGLLDLVQPAELGLALEKAHAGDANPKIARVVAGTVGPGWPFPDFGRVLGWRRLPEKAARCGRRPVIVRLGPDPGLSGAFAGATEAVFDLDEMNRVKPVEGEWYLLRHRGAGLVRQIRALPDRLEVLGQMSLGGGAPESLPLGSASVLRLVRGRLVWAGNGLDWSFLDHGGFDAGGC